MKRARLPATFALALAFATAGLAVFGFEPAAHAAGPDPAAEAQSLLTKLDAPETRDLVQAPVEKAKAAQKRAQSARDAGDLQHATELDSLALTWAHVADDLVRTAESEKKLADLQKAVADLEQKAVRTQALIEQTIARRGRAELNLKTATPTTRRSEQERSCEAGQRPRQRAPQQGQAEQEGGQQMMRRAPFWSCAVLSLSIVACAPTPRPEIMREVDSARASAAVQSAAKSAPQAYADAELRRTQAEQAFGEGKQASAQILSEQALAAYTRATVQARLARAQAALSDEQARLGKATAVQTDLDAQQQRFLLEAEALETRLKVVRDAEPLPVNAPASAEREQARLAAVKALLSQAKLLCMAARLLEPNRESVGPLLGKIEDLNGKLRTPPAPIDNAVATRSGCLKELTLARRPATQKNPAAGVADALLSELSASSLLPFRDDRGVVVTLRALFNGKDQLNSEASTQLDTLGKVAKAHPEFPLLAVVHVARGNASTRDAAQAAAIADALRKSGAPQVTAETAGSTLPVLDPARPGASERNARIEVVFVSPSSS